MPRENRETVALLEGRLFRLSVAEYAAYRASRLQQILETYADPNADLVELGCGAGLNLFSLRATGTWGRLLGYDISPKGIASARAMATHFGCKNMEFGEIDLRNGTHPNFATLKGRVAFSHYCLEQVPRDIRRVLENLRTAGPRRVIHMEPSTELLSAWRLVDLATAVYVVSQDYQRTLYGTLRDMEAAGRAAILCAGRLRSVSTEKNFPLIVVWEPR